jgi:RNA polymerase sigma-70 factor (ECF subfamily)
MSDHPSALLQQHLDRLRAGDPGARNALLEHAAERLRRLTRKMLGGFPRVGRWEDADDVGQNAALRLWRSLHEVTPPTVRDFYRLAALHIRRELLDLARHYYGPQGLGAHHDTVPPQGESAPGAGRRADPLDAGQTTHDPGRLAAWTDFHRKVEALPGEEREVFDLLYYQGLSQPEAAAVLGVSESTVKRRWQSARLALHEALEG